MWIVNASLHAHNIPCAILELHEWKQTSPNSGSLGFVLSYIYHVV